MGYVRFMVLNDTFNNISVIPWRSVFLNECLVNQHAASSNEQHLLRVTIFIIEMTELLVIKWSMEIVNLEGRFPHLRVIEKLINQIC